MAIRFLVVSTRPASEPLTSLEFLNVDCSGANVRWVVNTADMLPL